MVEVAPHTRPRAFARVIAAALLLGAGGVHVGVLPPSGGPSSARRSLVTVGRLLLAVGVAPRRAEAGADAVAVAAPDLGSIRVRGTYPRVPSRCVGSERRTLDARYPGTLSVERSEDGTLDLTLTLPFERYLEGIAEAPPSWPRAALEAQAVAARSYALATTGWTGAEGETLPTPICATTSCQVYRGMPVHADPVVRRWYRAVQHTSGRVLLFGGRPADTVYFSTSNGHTYGNEDVFGSAPARLPPAGRRARRRGLADVALEHASAVPGPRDVPRRGRRVAGRPGDLGRPARRVHDRRLGRRRDAVHGGEHLPRGGERLGAVPRARSLSAVAAAGHDPLALDDRLLGTGRRDHHRTRMGTRGRHGPVGRVRQGAPGLVGGGDPRLLLRRPAAAALSRSPG